MMQVHHGTKACYFCGTTQIDVQKRPLCRVPTHTLPMITAGIPSAILSCPDLGLPSQVRCPTSSAAFLCTRLSENTVSLLLTLVLRFCFSDQYIPTMRICQVDFLYFSQSPTFLYVILQWIRRAHRTRRTTLAPGAAGGAVLAAEQHQPVAKSDDSAGRAAFSGRSPPLPGLLVLDEAQPGWTNGCSAYRTQWPVCRKYPRG